MKFKPRVSFLAKSRRFDWLPARQSGIQLFALMVLSCDAEGSALGVQASAISLAGMRRGRLASLGGQFTLQTNPYHGLKFTLSLPLPEQDLKEMVVWK